MRCQHYYPQVTGQCKQEAICFYGNEYLCEDHARQKLDMYLDEVGREFQHRIATLHHDYQAALEAGIPDQPGAGLIEGTATTIEPNLTEQYIQECARLMQEKYGGRLVVRITQKAHPANYPAGAWFDDRIGETVEVAGVDLESIPSCFIMPNGDAIPLSCAVVVEIIRS